MDFYQTEYNNLIATAVTRNWCKSSVNFYIEIHHIVPRSLGGSNDRDNLVALTPQEHYEAHRLLALANPKNPKLWYAWKCMADDLKNNNINIDTDELAILKARIAKEHSIRVSGKNNPMYGRTRPDQIGDLNPSKRPEVRVRLSQTKMGDLNPAKRLDVRAKIKANHVGFKGKTHSKEYCNQLKQEKSKYIYYTPGGVFMGATDAAIYHNCHPMTLKYRCKSQLPQWEEWYRTDKQGTLNDTTTRNK
jgi:hypothetical protein